MLILIGGLIMYAYFQPRIFVEQEETDIKEMIDEEYELEFKRRKKTR